MQLGELVWVRIGPPKPTWGLVVNRYVVYLTDNSVMVTYEALVDGSVYQVDSTEILRFNYYNRHLYEPDDLET